MKYSVIILDRTEAAPLKYRKSGDLAPNIIRSRVKPQDDQESIPVIELKSL